MLIRILLGFRFWLGTSPDQSEFAFWVGWINQEGILKFKPYLEFVTKLPLKLAVW